MIVATTQTPSPSRVSATPRTFGFAASVAREVLASMPCASRHEKAATLNFFRGLIGTNGNLPCFEGLSEAFARNEGLRKQGDRLLRSNHLEDISSDLLYDALREAKTLRQEGFREEEESWESNPILYVEDRYAYWTRQDIRKNIRGVDSPKDEIQSHYQAYAEVLGYE